MTAAPSKNFLDAWEEHTGEAVSTTNTDAMAADSSTAASSRTSDIPKFVPQPRKKVSVNQPAAGGAEPPRTNTTAGAGTPFWKRRRFWMITSGVTAVLLIVVGLFAAVGFWGYREAMAFQAQGRELAAEGRLLLAALKTQNLPEAKQRMAAVEEDLNQLHVRYQQYGWAGSIPWVKTYYTDGEHGFAAAFAGISAGNKVIAAIEPHADLLGFEGETTFVGTTEDRIGVVLETLDQISPELDAIAEDIHTMQENLAAIDPNDYPESLRGYPVRSYIVQAQGAAAGAELALDEARPAVERLPAVAGSNDRRKYLVIFQNDNELRPTGGFMTAYAVVFVENGKVIPEKSDDIYELDQKFRNKPPIPEKLGRFLITENRWNLRDMNIDPNFKNSMETFYEYYQDIPGEPDDIDGIIAVDTVLLEKVVEILGPVDVPGYGTFSAQNLEICDCPQIIYALSEIIDRPTPYIRENRKGILAPMMQSIIQKTYATDRSKWPELASLLWEGIQGRHIQMHFMNEEDQLAAEAIGAAGIVPEMPESGDYLTVIDANLAGAKSNLFVETEGLIEVQGIENGRVRKQVELTYRNTHPPSNCNLEAGELCLNGNLNDWTRWYVPKGVEVEEVLGLEDDYTLDVSNDEYDVIEGIFRLSPLNQAKVRITYSVPYEGPGEYTLTMQKQGGTDPIDYQIITPWGEKDVVLDRDVTVTFE